MLEVRAARHGDAPALDALGAAPEAGVFVLEKNGAVIGALTLRAGEIFGCAVAPEWRGRGYGTFLLRRALRAAGPGPVYTQTPPGNAAMEALLRRARIASSKKLTVGGLTLDAEEHTAYLNGEEIPLTVREFNLIYKLLSYPKKTFTRSQLMDEFWDSTSTSGPRTVDVYMVKLREKFADCADFEIVTVHGLGYKAVLK